MIDIWERLKNEKFPILLWGTGNGADKILAELSSLGISVSGVFASDGFVRERTFAGFPVLSLSAAEEKFGDFVALFSFGSSRPEVLSNIKNVMRRHTLLAPEVPVCGPSEIFNLDFARRHSEKIREVYSLLADEKSRETFRETLLFKLDGEIERLFRCETSPEEIFQLLDFKNGSSFLDLGAYNGDTVREFVGLVPDFSAITAVEPDPKSFKKLQTVENEKIRLVNAAVSDTVGTVLFNTKASRGSTLGEGSPIPSVSVDSLAESGSFDYIKFDVEGAELLAILGAEKTILRDKPKMRIAAYHKSEDYFTLPLAVHKIRPDYKIYMRHLPSVPAWDTDFLFI